MTAEAILSDIIGYEVLSAGRSPDAEVPISADLIDWADIIFAMEGVHCRRLNERYSTALRTKRLIVLNIADEYSYMDPLRIEIL